MGAGQHGVEAVVPPKVRRDNGFGRFGGRCGGVFDGSFAVPLLDVMMLGRMRMSGRGGEESGVIGEGNADRTSRVFVQGASVIAVAVFTFAVSEEAVTIKDRMLGTSTIAGNK